MAGKIALVTGCSTGVGLHTAVRLAGAGYSVVATMRDVSKQQSLLDEAYAISMFSQTRIARINVGRKSLMQALEPLLHEPPPQQLQRCLCPDRIRKNFSVRPANHPPGRGIA